MLLGELFRQMKCTSSWEQQRKLIKKTEVKWTDLKKKAFLFSCDSASTLFTYATPS